MCTRCTAGGVKLGLIGGIHDGAVRICDADRARRWALVENGGRHGTKVGGAATVGDTDRVRWNDSWGNLLVERCIN